jgi:hypothetical protein
MSDANDINRLLGHLQAQAEETTRQLAALFKKLDDLGAAAHADRGRIELLTSQLAGAHARIAAMEPAVADYKSLKLKGLGVLGVIALLGSGAGVGLSKVLHLFSGAPQ